jgi:hypothetical protein
MARYSEEFKYSIVSKMVSVNSDPPINSSFVMRE